MKDYVLVLGSGKSIMDFTSDEKQLLDQCSVKIAINKFAAFYEKAGISPTHVYFQDVHDISSILMLKYIFKLFRKQDRTITFIISKLYKNKLFKNYLFYIFHISMLNLKKYINLALVRVGRYTLKIINVDLFNKYVFVLAKYLTTEPILYYNLVPKNSRIYYVSIKHCENSKGFWAKSIKEDLYHFKGSFSSVLNYISIAFPKKTVLLAGVDFDSPNYFFEKELSDLNFQTKDWTYNLRTNHRKHFSIIETNGVKIDDAMPFMIDNLKQTNNKVFSLNENSYLVRKGFVESIRVKDV